MKDIVVNETLKISNCNYSTEEGIEVAETPRPAIEVVAAECDSTFDRGIRNDQNRNYRELICDHGDRLARLYSDCKDAQLEVCINVVGIVFDLYGIPARVATKGSKNIVKAMNQEAKDKLSSITSFYFSNPTNVIHVAKGLRLISDLILYCFGDIRSVMKAAFEDTLSAVDYMIIATCISLNISLLFVTGGTELIISLTLLSKTIYDVSSSVIKMTMLEQEYDSLVQR
jgi:hypothetical protein